MEKDNFLAITNGRNTRQKQNKVKHMAIRKVSEGVSQWNNKMEFPKDRYVLHCVEEEAGISKGSGNPMVTRTWEIVAGPEGGETIQVGDKVIGISGAKVTQYRPTKVRTEDKEGWDPKKSDKKFGEFRDELVACGFEGEDIDDETPPCFMKGKTVEAVVYGKKDVSRKPQTPEQKKKNEPGDAIKDADGKEVVTYQLNIEMILGLSSTSVNAAY